jgi:glycerate kinase
MKVVVAIDSFKGCLSSEAVEAAAARGVADVFPDAEILCVPVADGGEGTVEALVEGTNGRMATISVHDPLMRPIRASYGLSGDGQTAIIEMSAASGLTLLSEEERNPLRTTTYGTGELILDAVGRGCRRFILGVGGSATNDAGIGMLQALGFRFIRIPPDGCSDRAARRCSRLPMWIFPMSSPSLSTCRFRLATDVKNPLFGPEGAAYVFARQKGGDDRTIPMLDEGLRHFSEVVKRSLHKDISKIPGAGAGGGFAAGCLAFLNASMVSGITLVLEQLHFDEKLRGASFVITGEGRMDAQTLQGKVPVGVAEAASRQQIPVYAVAGRIEPDVVFPSILKAFPLTDPPVPLERSMQPDFAKDRIREVAQRIAREWKKTQGKGSSPFSTSE